MMYLGFSFLGLIFLNTASGQDANCDFLQNVQVGAVYNFTSPGYPRNYTPGVQCRWTGVCPVGYNCRLDCPIVELPQSPSCSKDRLLVSLTGDPQLYGADVYCGRGSLTAVSKEQRITIGLITARTSPGGRFLCQLRAQIAPPPVNCVCGGRKQTRIVGGEETGVNEFPMMVGLVNRWQAQVKCGGTIISSSFVLTSAHCLVGQKVDDIMVLVGAHNVTYSDSPATKGYKVKRFIIHPQYTDSNYDYDIALIEVAGPIQLSDRVGVVCLPFKFVATNFTGAKVLMLGWGTTFFGGPTSDVLLKVKVDVISDAQCRTKVANLSSRQMCTLTPGKDACQDDSGGPVLYTDPSTGRLFNIGIVSYGRFCASNEPAINTKVTALLDWILTSTRESYCYM